MKLIKRTLFLVIGTVLLLLAYLMFSSKEYSYTSSIIVNGEIDEVYNFLKFLKNQSSIDIEGRDSVVDVQKKFFGEDGTVGAKCVWRCGNNYIQECTQVITELYYPETIEIKMVEAKPYNLSGLLRYDLKKLSNGTNIQMHGTMHFPFPYNVVLLFPKAKEKIDDGLNTHLNDLSIQFKK